MERRRERASVKSAVSAALLIMALLTPSQLPADVGGDLEAKLTAISINLLDAIVRSQVDDDAQLRIDYEVLTPEAQKIVADVLARMLSIKMRREIGNNRDEMVFKITPLGFRTDGNIAKVGIHVYEETWMIDSETGEPRIDPRTNEPEWSSCGDEVIVTFRKENLKWRISRLTSLGIGGLFDWDKGEESFQHRVRESDLGPVEDDSQSDGISQKSPDVSSGVVTARGSVNKREVVKYALAHAATGTYNPQYRPYGRDCTNFSSQALFAGEYPMTRIPNKITEKEIRKVGSWWYKHDKNNNYKKEQCTSTWWQAACFPDFVKASGRGSYGPASGASWEPGDLMAIAYKGGRIFHMLIISGKDKSGWPKVCCHTANRRDESLLKEDGLWDKHKDKDWYVYNVR